MADSLRGEDDLIASWFLGPKAENAKFCSDLLQHIFDDYTHWRKNYKPSDRRLSSRDLGRLNQDWKNSFEEQLDWLLGQLKAHFPFYSPRYIAHMLSEQTIPSMLGYFAGMLYNPNNVTDEAAPVTVTLELEVGQLIGEMVGYKKNKCWAHLCSGGTVANLEALWVARAVQFLPFCIQEFCSKEHLAYELETPDGRRADLRDLAPRDLIGLKPSVSISLITGFPTHLARKGQTPKQALETLNAIIRDSKYNIRYQGLHQVLKRVNLTPVIFVSAAAHYSIRKAANVLGYGEDSVDPIPIDSLFRLDINQLRERIFNLPDAKFVAAVVGIVGTTEEGAIDPIHELHFLRSSLSSERNRSFWLHVDAAWGGYFASLFRGIFPEEGLSLEELLAICSEKLHLTETITLPTHNGKDGKKEEIKWDSHDLFKPFLALRDADSITIDPHKMGYVPYPVGLVAFRDGRVTQLSAQRAQYISEGIQGVEQIDDRINITAVGPYVLEGSKPGAAAAACWLAHKVIPLDVTGLGMLMGNTLLSARRLNRYLERHKKLFDQIDQELSPRSPATHPFTFLPVCLPDTNIVCFLARPLARCGGDLAPADKGLGWINQLNERIWKALSINPAGEDVAEIHSRDFFVSRTKFEAEQYGAVSLQESLLDSLGINVDDYERNGLFILRATVMNPFYPHTRKLGQDFLLDFVKCLHKVTRPIVEDLWRAELDNRRP